MTLEFTPAGFDAFQNNITNVSTVLVGTATSTGTASQALQVGSATTALGAYISGSVGIGTTRPTAPLEVQGISKLNDTIVCNIQPTTVSYASSFSVAGQEASPQEVSFSNDGKTMYLIGSTGDDITWYTLSTPWDITTATHVSQFSVVGQESGPVGLYFKPDGTKFYVVGTTTNDAVYQYSCRTPWDLTTASYDSVSYIVVEDTNPQGVEFKPDGTRMYVVGATNDSVYQYSLSTPWDVSTVSYGSSFSIAGQESGPQGIRFSYDGTKLLLTGSSGDDINYYNLSTPWDITTTSFVGIITSVGAAPFNETSPAGLYWKPDGTRLYLTGSAADTIYQFNMTSDADLEVTGKTSLYGDLHIYEDTNVYGELSVSSIVGVGTTTSALKLKIQGDTNLTGRFNVSGSVGIGTTNPTSKLTVFGDTNINNIQPTTVSYASSFRVATQETEPREVFFSNDGKTMYVLGNTGDDITWYTLSTPWDITTSTHVSQFSIASQLTVPTGFYFKPDGTKFYVTGTTGVGAAATSVNQYSCSTPWDLTTASYDSVAYSVIAQDTAPQGVEFKPDGTRMYIIGNTNDSVYQYSLSTPWDLSTVSYGSSFSIASQETIPEGIRFSLDGTKLLLTGSAGDDINYYTLSTPWDITTTSFVGIITTVGAAPFNEITPSGLYWKPDGTRLYLSGYTNDTVWQFNMTSDADLEVTGKTSLYGQLHIYESTTLYSDLNVNNIVGVGTTTSALKLKIQGDTNLTGRFNVSGSVGIGTTNPLGILQVGSASTTGAGTSMVLVTSTGSVGIGTTNPLGTLQVGAGTSVVVITSIGAVGIGTTNPQYKLQVQGSSAALDTRVHSVAEKTVRIDGNTASLVYNTGSGNIAICTNPTGDITLNVTGIPTDSSFDNYSLTFSVMVNNTGTARSCTVVTLNGLSSTIRWAGGSLAAAIAGVTTTNGMDIYSFTGINTIGSASTTANYYVMGVVNGGYR